MSRRTCERSIKPFLYHHEHNRTFSNLHKTMTLWNVLDTFSERDIFKFIMYSCWRDEKLFHITSLKSIQYYLLNGKGVIISHSMRLWRWSGIYKCYTNVLCLLEVWPGWCGQAVYLTQQHYSTYMRQQFCNNITWFIETWEGVLSKNIVLMYDDDLKTSSRKQCS